MCVCVCVSVRERERERKMGLTFGGSARYLKAGLLWLPEPIELSPVSQESGLIYSRSQIQKEKHQIWFILDYYLPANVVFEELVEEGGELVCMCVCVLGVEDSFGCHMWLLVLLGLLNLLIESKIGRAHV